MAEILLCFITTPNEINCEFYNAMINKTIPSLGILSLNHSFIESLSQSITVSLYPLKFRRKTSDEFRNKSETQIGGKTDGVAWGEPFQSKKLSICS